MVDIEVKSETKAVLLEMFGNDTSKLLDHIFNGGVLDVNKCRIAFIKRHYFNLCKSGIQPAQAKAQTAERFFRSEKTIENIIYNTFYKDIII
jgi:hypothetical protein